MYIISEKIELNDSSVSFGSGTDENTTEKRKLRKTVNPLEGSKNRKYRKEKYKFGKKPVHQKL